jgi:hypothetical protein
MGEIVPTEILDISPIYPYMSHATETATVGVMIEPSLAGFRLWNWQVGSRSDASWLNIR